MEYRGKVNRVMKEGGKITENKGATHEHQPPVVNGHSTHVEHQGSRHPEIPQLVSQPLSLSCVVLSKLLKPLKLWLLPQETVGNPSPLKQDKNERIMYIKKNSAHTWYIPSLQKWQLLYFC